MGLHEKDGGSFPRDQTFTSHYSLHDMAEIFGSVQHKTLK